MTSQERIQSTRYQVGLDRPSVQSYNNLLVKLDALVIEGAYRCIESKLEDITKYVDEWLRYVVE